MLLPSGVILYSNINGEMFAVFDYKSRGLYALYTYYESSIISIFKLRQVLSQYLLQLVKSVDIIL